MAFPPESGPCLWSLSSRSELVTVVLVTGPLDSGPGQINTKHAYHRYEVLGAEQSACLEKSWKPQPLNNMDWQ